MIPSVKIRFLEFLGVFGAQGCPKHFGNDADLIPGWFTMCLWPQNYSGPEILGKIDDFHGFPLHPRAPKTTILSEISRFFHETFSIKILEQKIANRFLQSFTYILLCMQKKIEVNPTNRSRDYRSQKFEIVSKPKTRKFASFYLRNPI